VILAPQLENSGVVGKKRPRLAKRREGREGTMLEISRGDSAEESRLARVKLEVLGGSSPVRRNYAIETLPERKKKKIVVGTPFPL